MGTMLTLICHKVIVLETVQQCEEQIFLKHVQMLCAANMPYNGNLYASKQE